MVFTKSQPTAFVVRHALSEEANSGWIWITGRSVELSSRGIVRISNPIHRGAVYAEARIIDRNFCCQYNDNPGRYTIDTDHDTVVMGDWYRDSVGVGTSGATNKPYELVIKRPPFVWWGALKVGCHHPDPIVRISTRLGMLGVWLGILGVCLGGWSIALTWSCIRWRDDVEAALAILFGLSTVVGFFVQRGRPHPRAETV